MSTGSCNDQNMSNSSKTAGKTTLPVDVSSNVWRLFLDSKCSSATVFFRLHLSGHSYFHSPTPWNPGSNTTLPRKVAKLLDSFRPGSSSYSPFQSKLDVNNNSTVQTEQSDADEVQSEIDLLHNLEAPSRATEISSSPISIASNDENINVNPNVSHSVDITNNDEIPPEEVNRRRLYLNLGRPRPFYRVNSSNVSSETRNSSSNVKKPRVLQTLQEEARNALVTKHGLRNLSKMVKTAKSLQKLPQLLQNFLLTFPCHIFEEVGSDRPNKSASYNVRCTLDGQIYTAVFATSEVDKNVGNLWEEESQWIKLNDDGVNPILAIAIDPLTENIFYIINQGVYNVAHVLNTNKEAANEVLELLEKVWSSACETLDRLCERDLIYNSIKEENIKLCNEIVLLENPLMVKSVATNVEDKAVGTLKQQLGCVLQNLLNDAKKEKVDEMLKNPVWTEMEEFAIK